MRWRAAPAWVRAADLSVWVGLHAKSWPPGVAHLALDGAASLRESIALALTFPGRRSASILEADEAVVRLRERLRLAHGMDLLDDAQLRYADARLAEIGRMLGGWQRRRRERSGAESERLEGVDPATETA